MTLELPNIASIQSLSAEDLRLELACALYERGRLGKVAGAEFAMVDFYTFQKALRDRHLSSDTEEMLDSDLHSLDFLSPR